MVSSKYHKYLACLHPQVYNYLSASLNLQFSHSQTTLKTHKDFWWVILLTLPKSLGILSHVAPQNVL